MPISPLWLLSLWSWLASLSSGALWSYGSAFIVLVGVVGETITELTEWITPESARKRVAKISAIILILGLTGDLLGIRETQLEVAALTKEAGDAKKSAEGAASAADRAKASVDNANTVAGDALGKSKAANQAAGNAQEKVNAVAKRAETIDRGLRATQMMVSARYVQEPDALADALRQFKGQAVILARMLVTRKEPVCAVSSCLSLVPPR